MPRSKGANYLQQMHGIVNAQVYDSYPDAATAIQR